MKKWMALLLAVLMALATAGCAQGNPGDQNAKDESWEKVQSAGEFVLGMDSAFPPMGYKDTQTGELIGFDIDLAKEVCNRLGVKLTLLPIDWNAKQDELDNGNVDCLWNGFSWTEERDEKCNLSFPYMKNNQIILVKSDSSYQNFADLAGKRLGVQAKSSAEDALNAATEFKSSLAEVVSIKDYGLAVQEIDNGSIDCIAIDEVVARFYTNKDPGKYRILMKDDSTVESLQQENFVIGFRKNDNALKAKVEETLTAMAKDGTLKRISEEWFGEDVTTVEG
jgi:polar amino acid transport system substrate-binding protein